MNGKSEMQKLREAYDYEVKSALQCYYDSLGYDDGKLSYRQDLVDWEFHPNASINYDDLAGLNQFIDKVSCHQRYRALRLRFAELGYTMRLQQEKMLLAGVKYSTTIFLQNGYAYERGDFEKVNDLLCQLELLRRFDDLRRLISAMKLGWDMVLPAVDDLAARAHGRRPHLSMLVTVHMHEQVPEHFEYPDIRRQREELKSYGQLSECYKHPADVVSVEYPFNLTGLHHLSIDVCSSKKET